MKNNKNIIITTYPFFENYKEINLLKSLNYNIIFNEQKRKLKKEEIKTILNKINPEIIVAGTEKYDLETLDLCTNLKLISRVGVGMDSVDLKECKKRNIVVKNTPNTSSNAVSELVIGQIFNALRKINIVNNDLKNKKWNRFVGKDIIDCKIGIIGCGRIGKTVIKKIIGLGVKHIYINDIIKEKTKIDGCIFKEKNEILKKCDIISIHIPLNLKNKNYICEKELNLIKKNGIIINTSRGGIINEKNLYNWLKNNEDKTAVIDVFENEPYEGELIELGNVLLTPHLGSCTEISRYNMECRALKNVIKFLKK